MIKLGTISIINEQSIVDCRNKIRDLCVDLNFGSVQATRVATAVSEFCVSQLSAADTSSVDICFGKVTQQSGILLVFRDIPDLTASRKYDFLFDDISVVSESGRLDLHAFKIFPDLNYIPSQTFIDATKQKIEELSREELMEHLEKAKVQAVASAEAKGAFLANMSHEIRTPMNGVLGMVDLLKGTKLDNEQNVMLRTISDSGKSLLTIINDILDFSKIEAGKLELEDIECSLSDLVNSSAQNLAPSTLKKNLQLLTFITPEIPENILCDPVRIRQILINLTGNGLKFSDSGEVLIKVELGKEEVPDRTNIRFNIVDQGIGISEEAQGLLFQDFNQADSSTTREFGGTGLGLAICKRLSEMMGGCIGVTSSLGKGSTFYFEIPFNVPDKVARHTVDLQGLRVLLISNNDNYLDVATTYLRDSSADYEVLDDIAKSVDFVQQYHAAGKSIDVVYIPNPQDYDEIEITHNLFLNGGLSTPPKFVVGVDPRKPQATLSENKNITTHDINPQSRVGMMTAISISAGRTAHKAEDSKKPVELVRKKAPTPKEALEQGKLILIAEDNLTNQDVINRQLNRLGYACEIASNGKEAYQMWNKKHYAVLLTDCHMPEWDGFQLTAAIREDEKSDSRHAPIIAITANALQGEAENCISKGMDDYMSKPIDMQVLQSKLSKWMGDGGKVDSTPPPTEEQNVSASTLSSDVKPTETEVNDSINERTLMAMFGDDKELFREILNDFIEPSWDVIKEMHLGFDNRSSRDIKMSSHKLKSAAFSVGAEELGELCKNLEEAAGADDWSIIDQGVPKVAGIMSKVEQYISRV